MKKAFAAFVATPSREHYLAARHAALRASRTKATSEDFARLVSLAEAARYPELLQAADELPLTAQLSPRLHYLMWTAAQQLGEAEEAELQRYLFAACLRGILETGNGSCESPYLIIHLNDEYDVLLALGKEAHSQRLIERNGRSYDVLRCMDGEEIWFELGSLQGQAGRKQPRKIPKRRLRVVR